MFPFTEPLISEQNISTIDIINVIITYNANLVVIKDLNCFLKVFAKECVSHQYNLLPLKLRVLDFFYVDLLFIKIDS